MLDILMPTEEGRYIPQEVLDGILSQAIPFRLWVSTKISGGNYAQARNNIKQYGRTQFLLMLDNDIILPAGAVKKMMEFLKSHPKYAAIALAKHDWTLSLEEVINPPHVEMSCVLFRKEILDEITFSEPRKEGVSSQNPTVDANVHSAVSTSAGRVWRLVSFLASMPVTFRTLAFLLRNSSFCSIPSFFI